MQLKMYPFESRQFESHQRRHPFLALFDVTLNLALCSAIFAFACALLGIILNHNAPVILSQISYIAARLMN